MRIKTSWKDQEGGLPDLRLKAFGMHWRINEGANPLHSSVKDFARLWPAFDDVAQANFSDDMQIAPSGDVFGHHVATDNHYGNGLDFEYPAVTLPLYVRDLAGRMVYLPMGYERCNFNNEWVLPESVSFPAGVKPVDMAKVGSVECFDNVFFTSFRNCDMSHKTLLRSVDGDEDYMISYYAKPQAYPYKMRLDTFYIDGWKIPQTQMLYAKPMPERLSEQEAKIFYEKWHLAKDKGYEAFIEALGENALEDMFEKGVTLIPTFEACNGYNKVSADFDLEDYYPGRAVLDLHKVVESRVSDLPEGTIIEVRRPGVMMSHRIEPAEVVVSDGSNYRSPHGDMRPSYPNLKYPHQRISSQWGAVWVPTKPQHFEPPAIWGWDEKTNHFVQLKGPMWDPLHYYYESVTKVAEVYKKGAIKGSAGLYAVPEEMKLKFYPVKEMRHMDVVATSEEQQQACYMNSHIFSVDLDKIVVTVGYHPLPENMDYELSPYWFAYLNPQARQNDEVPIQMTDKLTPVISSAVAASEYKSYIDLENAVSWLKDEGLYEELSGDTYEDYPQLKFYQGMGTPEEALDETFVNVSPPFAGGEYPKALDIYPELKDHAGMEKVAQGCYKLWLEMRQAAVSMANQRLRLFKDDIVAYITPYWYVGYQEQTYFEEEEFEEQASKPVSNVAIMGVGEL